MVVSEARISDHRFENPLRPDDQFQDIKFETGDFDLKTLKETVEDSALKNAHLIRNRIPQSSKSLDVTSQQEITAQRILELLCLRRYRRGSRTFVDENKTEHLEKIMAAVKSNRPIEIILSFFGYKVRNPLKTWAEEGSEVDLSEVASLLRFHEIAVAIQQLYPPGAKIRVACDGRKYAPAVGYAEDEGSKYFSNLAEVASFLGINNTVDLFEESDFYPHDIQQKRAEHIGRIKTQYESGCPETASLIDQLKCSLALTIPVANRTSLQILHLAFCSTLSDQELRSLNPEAYDVRRWLCDESVETAIRYIGSYNAVKEAGVLETVGHLALRGTVHPKPGQIGLYAVNEGSNNIFPHHGQGVAKGFNASIELDEVRVKFRADLERCSQASSLRGIVLPPEKYPFSNGKHPFTFVQQN